MEDGRVRGDRFGRVRGAGRVVEQLQARGLAYGRKDDREQAGAVCAVGAREHAGIGAARPAGGRCGAVFVFARFLAGEHVPGAGLELVRGLDGAGEREHLVGATVGGEIGVDAMDMAGGGLAINMEEAANGGEGVALAKVVPHAIRKWKVGGSGVAATTPASAGRVVMVVMFAVVIAVVSGVVGIVARIGFGIVVRVGRGGWIGRIGGSIAGRAGDGSAGGGLGGGAAGGIGEVDAGGIGDRVGDPDARILWRGGARARCRVGESASEGGGGNEASRRAWARGGGSRGTGRPRDGGGRGGAHAGMVLSKRGIPEHKRRPSHGCAGAAPYSG
ncbi:MAG TPA: hypothetical protein VIC85_07155 [Ktedonobacterales bacterium]